MTDSPAAPGAARHDEPSAGDLLIATFFQKWSPAPRDASARFHLDFVRVVQQITLEAARPYHMLLRDALAQQPLMAARGAQDNASDIGQDNPKPFT